MKKKLKIIIILLSINLLCGCSSALVSNNNQNKNINSDSLNITGINVPSYLPNLKNKEEFVNLDYNIIESNKIEIIFNKDIIDKDYVLGYLQYANYYGIKNEFDKEKHIFFKYTIEKNKLIITPDESFLTAGVVSIYVPNTIESVDNKKIGSNKLFIFSSNALNDNNIILTTNTEIQRETKSLILIKRKNDNSRIAFINKSSSLLNSANDNDDSGFLLERGETVIILEELSDYYKIELKFSDLYSPELFNNIKVIEKNNDHCSIIGYLSKNYIVEVPEPLNNDSFYAIQSMPDHDKTNVHIIVCNPISYSFDFIVNDNVNKIISEDLYLAESYSLYIASSMFLFGELPINSTNTLEDKLYHMPELVWNEIDYSTFYSAYEMYYSYFINIINKYKLPIEVESIRNILLKKANNIINSEIAWKDWGYINNLKDKNYYFDTLIIKLSINEQDFMAKNGYNKNEVNANDMVNFYNSITEYNNKDFDIDTLVKNAVVKYNINLVQGKIIKISLEENSFDVLDDDRNMLFTFTINDYVKNNIELKENVHVNLYCNYDFDKNLYNVIKKIEY